VSRMRQVIRVGGVKPGGSRRRTAGELRAHRKAVCAIHLCPRSVLSAAPALVPALDANLPEGRSSRPPALRRRLVALLAAGLVVATAVVSSAGTWVVLARFTDAAAVASNNFAAGTWVTATTWYLHNNPTPPTGNTAAQFNLPLNATSPTVATLFNYDTGCESRVGRSLIRGTGLVGETGACSYATWRSAALVASRTLNGSATLVVWARKTAALGTNPTLRAFFRVFHPATSTWTDLGTANVTVSANPTAAWARLSLAWSLAGATVAVGQQIEVKVVATSGTRDIEIAYDTTTSPSSLALP